MMMLKAVLLDDLPDEWPRLAEGLRDVIGVCGNETLGELYARLRSAWASAFDVSGPASGVVVLSIGDEPEKGRVLWIDYLTGKIEGGVKRRARTMQTVLTEIELIARADKCVAVGGMVRRGAGWVRFATRLGYRVEDDKLWKVLV